MLYKSVVAFVASAVLAGAASAAEPMMNAQDPAALAASLKEMGYAPDPIDTASDSPSTVITSGGSRYWLVLGGCTNKRACDYLVLGSSFSDVVDPPAAWVAEQNKDFDTLKVWTNDQKQLTYSASVLTTGLTRAQFRAFLDALTGSESVLGNRASEAKLVK
jgi:hypothetical protein